MCANLKELHCTGVGSTKGPIKSPSSMSCGGRVEIWSQLYCSSKEPQRGHKTMMHKIKLSEFLSRTHFFFLISVLFLNCPLLR